MGRSPDYKPRFLRAGREFRVLMIRSKKTPGTGTRSAGGVTFVNHAIVNPPVDRNKELAEVRDVYMHVEKETDGGLIVSGAKLLRPTSALTHYNFIANNGPCRSRRRRPFVCIVPPMPAGLNSFAALPMR